MLPLTLVRISGVAKMRWNQGRDAIPVRQTTDSITHSIPEAKNDINVVQILT